MHTQLTNIQRWNTSADAVRPCTSPVSEMFGNLEAKRHRDRQLT